MSVGENGKVIGVGMTEAILEKARANAGKLDFTNVGFRLRDIANLPVESALLDVDLMKCLTHCDRKWRKSSQRRAIGWLA